MSCGTFFWTACVAASTHLNLRETFPTLLASDMESPEDDYHPDDPKPAKRLTGIVDNVWYASDRLLYTEP